MHRLHVKIALKTSAHQLLCCVFFGRFAEQIIRLAKRRGGDGGFGLAVCELKYLTHRQVSRNVTRALSDENAKIHFKGFTLSQET